MGRISATERRSALLEAAATVIAREGVAAASTRAIVAEAGMSLASFHYVFESHNEMMTALVRSVLQLQRDWVAPRVENEGSMREAVAAGMLAYFEHLRALPEREQALFELFHYALRTPELEHFARTQYEHYFSSAIQLLEEGATELRLGWDRPVSQVAEALVALTDGVALNWLAMRDEKRILALIDVTADAISSMSTALPRESPA